MKDNRLAIFFYSLVGIYIFIAVCCYLTPWAADDFVYGQGHGLLDLLKSEYTHYMTWNGRSIPTMINRLLLVYPNIFYVLLTPLVYVTVLFSMLALVFGKNWKKLVSWKWVLLLHCLLWFFLPRYGTVVFWRCGTANYLWTTFFAFLFLVPYRFFGDSLQTDCSFSPARFGFLASCGMFILGLLAGWGMENMGSVAFLLSCVAILYGLLQRRKAKTQGQYYSVPLWAWAGAAGAFLGILLLLLSPGSAARSASVAPIPLAEFVLGSLKTLLRGLRYNLLPYGVVGFCFFALAKKKALTLQASWLCIVFLLASLAAIAPLMAVNSSFVVQRAFTSPFLFAVIAALSALAQLWPHLQPMVQQNMRKILTVTTLLLAMGLVMHSGRALYHLHAVHKADVQRIALYTGFEPHVVVKPYPFSNSYAFIGKEIRDVGTNPDFWVNMGIVSYYGKFKGGKLSSVRLESF